MQLKNIQIANRTIGNNHAPFIIAEMSGNHNQSFDRAIELVDAAAAAGVDAIKLQTYTADTMTIDNDFVIDGEQQLWEGKNLYQLYKEAYTPWEWHQPIFEHAKKKGLIPFSSPFDESAVDFLEGLDVACYKIASFENNDFPLLKKVAATGKPVIMSTGMTNASDIDESVRYLKENGCEDLIILKCTSTYPATPENSNILTIPHMRQLFNCHVGLSDHTMGIGVAVGAVALGAKVVEKHFTLSRADGGVDSAFSLEPSELALLKTECDRAFQGLGRIQYNIQKAEKSSKSYKRSIYVAKAIAKGEKFSKENLKVIRPGEGLAPKYFEQIIGKVAKTELKEGTPLSFDALF